MQEETKNQIWEKLKKFAEKRVRQEKTGYLQLVKIQDRDPAILKDITEFYDKIEREETEKGYAPEDLRFYCYISTHNEWYTYAGLEIENKVSGRRETGSTSIRFKLDYSKEKVTKGDILRAKELEKRFKEEEQIARQHLKHELEEKDRELEEKAKEIERLKARVQELEMQLEPEPDQETEEEDA